MLTIELDRAKEDLLDLLEKAAAGENIVITKNALPVVNLGKDSTICDSLILSVGNGNFNTILWSTNDTVKSIVVTNAGL